MFNSGKLRHVLVTGILITLLGGLVFADTIHLKDGSIIKGHIVRFENETFTIAMGEGSRKREMTFGSSEIASIAFDSPQTPSPANNPSTKAVSYNPSSVNTDPSTERQTSAADATPVSAGEKMKPIEWQVKVLADNTSNGWTNSGWVVKKGQKIRVTGDGKVSLGKSRSSTPGGLPDLDDPQKLLKNVPTGALIGVIGDDNNEFIYIGEERTFTATRDGALFLGVNEGNLNDNSGSYNVKVEILPDGN